MILPLIFVLMMSLSPSDSFGIPSVTQLKSLLEWVYEIYSKVAEAYDLYGTVTSTTSLDTIVNKLNEISKEIDQLGSRLEQKMDVVIQTLIRRLPLIAQVDQGFNKIAENVIRIDSWYEKFEYYIKYPNKTRNRIKERFADTILDHSANGLEDILESIFGLLIPGRSTTLKESLLMSVIKAAQESEKELCDLDTSPQHRLFQLYSIIIITEMRSYAIMAFAYSFLSNLHNESYSGSLERVEKKLTYRVEKYMKSIQSASKSLPRDMRICDPLHHKRGTTYTEFEGALTIFIGNEVDMNKGRSCKAACGSVPVPTELYGNYDSNWHQAHSCVGKIYDCSYGGGKMQICQLPNTQLIRYDWFKVSDGTLYGSEHKCSNGWMKYPYGWTSGVYDCDYCVCTCAAVGQNSKATYMFSLRKQLADFKRNMVVTGVRIVNKNSIIHIQIEQGQLGPEGSIVDGTSSWVPLEDMKINTNHKKINRFDTYPEVYIDGGKDSRTKRAYPADDYLALDWDERSIFLDDLYVPHDQVITGVKFGSEYSVWDQHGSQVVMLYLLGTPFNYMTGKLNSSIEFHDFRWFNHHLMKKPERSPYYDGPRREVKLKYPDDPTKSQLNLPDSTPNSYVQFRPSDTKKDAGRHTIPYFDILPVTSRTKFPLQGVGLLHRGYDGFGGFIAPRIMGIDISQYFNMTQ